MPNPIEDVLYSLGIDLAPLRSSAAEADNILADLSASVTTKLGKVATAVGIFLGVRETVNALKALGSSVVSVSSQMETYRTRLLTLYKDQQRVEETLRDIVEFAAKTPFEIPGLVDATVQLEAFGQSAEKWLPLVGEFAAAMSIDIRDAARAVARALSGSAEGFEVLRNAGINSAKLLAAGWSGSYQDIESTAAALEKVLGEFSGGMERQSRTFAGIMSNISDTLTQFQLLIGREFFPEVKEVFDGIRARLSEMFDTGEAERWAERLASILNVGIHAFGLFAGVVDKVLLGADKLFSLFEREPAGASLKALTENFSRMRDSIREQEESVNSLLERYRELAEQARSQGKTVQEAAAENEELREVIDKLAEIVPEAAEGWDKYGRAIGISTEQVNKFLEAQRLLEASELRKVGEEYRKQFDTISERISKAQGTLETLSRASKVSFQEFISSLEGEKRPDWAETILLQPFESAKLRLFEIRRTSEDQVGDMEALYEEWRKVVGKNVRQIRGELQSYETELNVTRSYLQRFIKVSGLEEALNVVREFSKYPGPQTTSEVRNLALAYAQIAEVFGIDFRERREEAEAFARELLRVAEMDFTPKVRPPEQKEFVFQADVVSKEIEKIYNRLQLEAREAALAQGEVWSRSAEEMLDLFERATQEYLKENEGVQRQQIENMVEWRQKRAELLEKALKESRKAADEEFLSRKEALQNSLEFERATHQERIEMLQELGEEYANSAEARKEIEELVAAERLKAIRESVDGAIEEERRLRELTQRQRQEVLKAQREYGKSMVEIAKASSFAEAKAIIEGLKQQIHARIIAAGDNVELVKELQHQLQLLDVVYLKARARVYEDEQRLAHDSVANIAEEFFKLRGVKDRLGKLDLFPSEEERFIAQREQARLLLKDVSEDTLRTLSYFNLEVLKNLRENEEIDLQQYREILTEKLNLSKTNAAERIRIEKELNRVQQQLRRREREGLEESVRRWYMVGDAVDQVINAMDRLELSSRRVLSMFSSLKNIVVSIGTGDFMGTFLSSLELSVEFWNYLNEGLDQHLRELHKYDEQYDEAVEALNEWSFVLEERWIPIIQKYGQELRGVKLGSEEWVAIMNRWQEEVINLANEVVPVLEKVSSTIESSLSGVLSRALLGDIEDLGKEVREAIFRSVIAQVVSAFASSEQLEGLIKELTGEIFQAMEAEEGGDVGALERAGRRIMATSEQVVMAMEIGSRYIQQGLSPILNYLRGDELQQGIGESVEQLGEMTQSLARAITEPQANQLISLWSSSRDYLRDINSNVEEIRRMVEFALSQKGEPQLIVLNAQSDLALGSGVNERKRALGLQVY